VLLLYERYSQYNIPVHIALKSDKDEIPLHSHRLNLSRRAELASAALSNHNKPASDAAAADDERHYRFRCKVPGIADAYPPLQSDDVVLFRPVKALHWPRYDSRNPWELPIRWSNKASSYLEIQSRVAVIIRDTPTRAGGIEGPWLDPLIASTLRLAYFESKFNLRFIPNTKITERCLTALDWLGTLPKPMVMNLLFPDHAPRVVLLQEPLETFTNDKNDPLNDKQAAFVHMVLARTRSPSLDQVRGPMVLTGPAGTGTTKQPHELGVTYYIARTHLSLSLVPIVLCRQDKNPFDGYSTCSS
jgi:hypothetical protein